MVQVLILLNRLFLFTKCDNFYHDHRHYHNVTIVIDLKKSYSHDELVVALSFLYVIFFVENVNGNKRGRWKWTPICMEV